MTENRTARLLKRRRRWLAFILRQPKYRCEIALTDEVTVGAEGNSAIGAYRGAVFAAETFTGASIDTPCPWDDEGNQL